MDDAYQLDIQESIPQDAEKILSDGLNENDFEVKGMAPVRTFSILIRDKDKKILGGVEGVTLFGCVHVDMLWVKKILRHQGWGKRLMLEAEKIGRERGCTFATVNTMDWEAKDFYLKLGYGVEFQRAGYDNDSIFYFLKKEFISL